MWCVLLGPIDCLRLNRTDCIIVLAYYFPELVEGYDKRSDGYDRRQSIALDQRVEI